MVSQAFDFCMSERADREEMKERETKQRVVVAMSGGVDSSMAAALLLEQGYEVIGIMLRLWAEAGPAANRCCTPDAVADARHVADTLGIPFYLRDYKQIFKTTVVDYFTETYTHGLTPNPCLICNRQIRYGHLLNEAVALGAGYLATGHYARVRQTQDGAYQLLKGVDAAKDQSYVLHRLGQAQLAHVLFPLGEYVKSEVRGRWLKHVGCPFSTAPTAKTFAFWGTATTGSSSHVTQPELPGRVPSSTRQGAPWASTKDCHITPLVSVRGWASPDRRRSMFWPWSHLAMPSSLARLRS
jgi:hypothetical protein